MADEQVPPDDIPPFRYHAALANEIEHRWQDRWDAEHVFETPNRTGLLSEDPRGLAERPPLFVLDMFPYPSGVGLHVGHPLGYIAHRRVRPLPADERLQRPPHDGLRRVRPARRTVRGADRHPSPCHDRGEHRDDAPAAARPRARGTTRAAAPQLPMSSTTDGRSGSSCRSTTPGTTKRHTGRARSRRSCRSSAPGASRLPTTYRSTISVRCSSVSSSTRTASRTSTKQP